MTEATFDAATVEVNVSNVLGEVSIRVPPGVAVREELTNVLSDISVKGVGPVDPAMPTLVLTGTAILGNVKVRGPRKPLSWRRALP